uniref:protein-serine/threonine phosphatase n=1 Tax=Lygus hesperus TaxID=30085 RepID=A0A0A9W3U4_LYGHE
MGARHYARAICSLLDPNEVLFQGRIVSRNELPNRNESKQLSLLLPCDDALVLILDDRSDIWPAVLRSHIIQIYPFLFFTNATEVYDRTGTKHVDRVSTTSTQQQQQDGPLRYINSPLYDTVLRSLLPVLLGLWTSFYLESPFTVSNVRQLPRYLLQSSGTTTETVYNNPPCSASPPPITSCEIYESLLTANLSIDISELLRTHSNTLEDVPLPAHCDVTILHTALRSNLLHGLRILFSRLGLRKPVEQMSEFRTAQELGASFISFDAFQSFVDSLDTYDCGDIIPHA